MCAKQDEKGKTLIEKGLNMTYQSRNKRVYIKPLLDLNLITYTQKEFKKSKKQRYKITKKGLSFLAENKK
jgi:predicted transcriptional regulator